MGTPDGWRRPELPDMERPSGIGTTWSPGASFTEVCAMLSRLLLALKVLAGQVVQDQLTERRLELAGGLLLELLAALRDGKVDSREMVELRRRGYELLEELGLMDEGKG